MRWFRIGVGLGLFIAGLILIVIGAVAMVLTYLYSASVDSGNMAVGCIVAWAIGAMLICCGGAILEGI